jgi:ribosome biogenesis GTPase
MTLQRLGFDPWFTTRVREMEGCVPARVCAVDRGSYRVRNESGEAEAELCGRLSYLTDRTADLPCVGDWVSAQYYDNGRAAFIHEVLPRRTFLRRRAAGEDAREQMIAANVDTAFIIQACHFDFNPNRLERYLVMAADGRVEPVVLLTKTDLLGPGELERMRALVADVTRARVMEISSVTGAGYDELRAALQPGKTHCLLGSSGVGKTTIVNRLLGLEAFATRSVSGSGEGVHTTTRRRLILLDSGAMLIDTPGMRELGVLGCGGNVDAGFGELAELAAACRFTDCTHRHEPGCAVRAAMERGELPSERLANYMKLKKESDHAAMSVLDRRRKDKAFGRMVKSVQKRSGA